MCFLNAIMDHLVLVTKQGWSISEDVYGGPQDGYRRTQQCLGHITLKSLKNKHQRHVNEIRGTGKKVFVWSLGVVAKGDTGQAEMELLSIDLYMRNPIQMVSFAKEKTN